jgi:hypothetical protein
MMNTILFHRHAYSTHLEEDSYLFRIRHFRIILFIMHVVSFIIVVVYGAFIFSTTVSTTNCPDSPAVWCQTKEIAAACGVCANFFTIK